MKRIIPIILIIVIICCIALPFAVSAYSYTHNGITYYSKNVNVSVSGSTSFYDISSFGLKAYYYNGTNIKYLNCNYLQLYRDSTSFVVRLSSNAKNTSNERDQINITFNRNGGNDISTVSRISISVYNIGTSSTTWSWNNGGTTTNPNTSLNIDNIGIFFNIDFSFISPNSSNNYFILTAQDFNLYFNSNGGSTIDPITGIEPGGTVNLDVTIGGFTTYNPAFVPEREGYIFDYWYQIDYPLTPVHSITVNDDITLIAKWSNDPSLAYITFGDGFYSDVNHLVALTGGYYEIGSYIDFYTYYSGSQIYRGKVAFTDLNDDVTYYQGPSGSYRYHVQITESGSFSLVLLDYCTTYVSLYPDVEGTYVSHIQYAIQDGEWHNYTFDNALTIQPGYQLHFRFYLTAPYVITEGVYYYSLNDYENVFIRSDVKTNNDWQTFWTEVYLDFTVDHSGTLYLYVKSISDFDITSRDIVGIYDESTGEFSWAVSEVSLLDTNWEDVASNVPQNLAYMFDGIYSLSGLAIIVPLCMMVAFGLWFIRRS